MPIHNSSSTGPVFRIPIDSILPDPNHPRRCFRAASLQSLADDIQRRGVFQPLLVRQSGARFLILNGERRFRAARLLELTHLPCLVRKDSPAGFRQAQLVTAVLREDLQPFEKALALRTLYDDLKASSPSATWKEVTQMAGLSYGRIAHLYALVRLPDSILDMLRAGRISAAHASELARLELFPEDQFHLAEQSCRQPGGRRYGLSRTALRASVNRVLGRSRSLNALPPDIIDACSQVNAALDAISPAPIQPGYRLMLTRLLETLESYLHHAPS